MNLLKTIRAATAAFVIGLVPLAVPSAVFASTPEEIADALAEYTASQDALDAKIQEKEDAFDLFLYHYDQGCWLEYQMYMNDIAQCRRDAEDQWILDEYIFDTDILLLTSERDFDWGHYQYVLTH